ncbi:MAG TPA: hypothetical protein PLF13_01905 [candidate division Zixibacteria bacterium]|nr:hypothetical protein [candidate division Zixibacteria bacterium]
MDVKITNPTGACGLGNPGCRLLMKVATGAYAGRMALVFQNTANVIQLTWTDPPYAVWSTPINLASDAADVPFDAVMDADGAIQLAYTERTSEYVVTRHVGFTGGNWTSGARITVYDGQVGYYPSLAVDPDGRLWISFSRKEGSFYYLHVKSSDDLGLTWGTGTSDTGYVLNSGTTLLYSRIALDSLNIHVFYVDGGDLLAVRSMPLGGEAFEAAVAVVSTGIVLDQHFDIAVSDEGLIGVLFDGDQLKYREYDGANWGAIATLDENEAFWPRLKFVGNCPVACYLSQFAAGQFRPMIVTRRMGSFSDPEPLLTASDCFHAVLAWSGASSSFADLTSVAADAAVADLYHPDSGALLAQAGDQLYLGSIRPFRFVRLLLSTAGVGGSVAFAYFNGSAFTPFTPDGGAYDFDAADKELLLFDDLASAPVDWQKTTINGQNLYWIRIEVTDNFSTAPVGSQITSISNLTAFCVRR